MVETDECLRVCSNQEHAGGSSHRRHCLGSRNSMENHNTKSEDTDERCADVFDMDEGERGVVEAYIKDEETNDTPL